VHLPGGDGAAVIAAVAPRLPSVCFLALSVSDMPDDVLASSSVPVSDDPEFDQLTPRQGEVMRYLARGYAYKEIARALTISPARWSPMPRRSCASSSCRVATS
jgi:DNA-binding NarL/FixJ family response regulator